MDFSPIAGDTRPALRCVMLYSDRESGRRGMEIYRQLSRRMSGEFEPEIDLWSFDILSWPEMSARALADARRADVLIVAMSGKTVPFEVAGWLRRLALLKEPCEGVLIAVANGLDDGAEIPLSEVLEELAARTGMSLAVTEPGVRTGKNPRNLVSQ